MSVRTWGFKSPLAHDRRVFGVGWRLLRSTPSATVKTRSRSAGFGGPRRDVADVTVKRTRDEHAHERRQHRNRGIPGCADCRVGADTRDGCVANVSTRDQRSLAARHAATEHSESLAITPSRSGSGAGARAPRVGGDSSGYGTIERGDGVIVGDGLSRVCSSPRSVSRMRFAHGSGPKIRRLTRARRSSTNGAARLKVVRGA